MTETNTFIFNPTDDATVKLNSPNGNFNAHKVEVDNNPVEEALFKFTVSSTAERKVISAKLRLLF